LPAITISRLILGAWTARPSPLEISKPEIAMNPATKSRESRNDLFLDITGEACLRDVEGTGSREAGALMDEALS